MRTGSPMSSTNTSPPRAIRPASSTRPTASSMVMKKRVTSGWVTVTGPPLRNCSASTDSSEPREPRTLPNRTAEKTPVPRLRASRALAWTISSARRLLAPRTEVGSAALSVEISTNRSTPVASAASTRWSVPSTFDFTASEGCRSSSGRCLWAAAWKTTSGLRSRKICWIRGRSRMSAMTSESSVSSASPQISSCRRCRFDSSWSSM